MPSDTDIMKYEKTLPQGFTGTFYFTNWTDTEFVGVWGKKQYHFPAKATSPMIIPEHSPLEIQHIRKKFAKDLAEREFFKSEKYEAFRAPEGTMGNRTMSGIHTANTYNLSDLAEHIQKCLVPLEIKEAGVGFIEETALEDKLSRNEDNEINTGAIKSDKDLEKLAGGKLSLKDRS